MSTDLHQYADRPFDLLVSLAERLEGRGAVDQSLMAAPAQWVGLGMVMGEHRLVVPQDDVQEVLEPPEFTRVPGGQPWLLGLANVRGDLLPIIDLRRMMGMEPARMSGASRVVVLNHKEIPAGFLVDDVAGFRRFTPDDQRHELVPEDEGPMQPFLLGAFVHDGSLWVVFSLAKLATSSLFQNAGA